MTQANFKSLHALTKRRIKEEDRQTNPIPSLLYYITYINFSVLVSENNGKMLAELTWYRSNYGVLSTKYIYVQAIYDDMK